MYPASVCTVRIEYSCGTGFFLEIRVFPVGTPSSMPPIPITIGAVVGAVMIVTVSPVKAIIFIVFLVVLQQLEGNLIYPKVVGSSIGLPGIWVLAAVTVGGGVMGLPPYTAPR